MRKILLSLNFDRGAQTFTQHSNYKKISVTALPTPAAVLAEQNGDRSVPPPPPYRLATNEGRYGELHKPFTTGNCHPSQQMHFGNRCGTCVSAPAPPSAIAYGSSPSSGAEDASGSDGSCQSNRRRRSSWANLVGGGGTTTTACDEMALYGKVSHKNKSKKKASNSALSDDKNTKQRNKKENRKREKSNTAPAAGCCHSDFCDGYNPPREVPQTKVCSSRQNSTASSGIISDIFTAVRFFDNYLLKLGIRAQN